MKESEAAKMIREVMEYAGFKATEEILKKLGPSIADLDKDMQIKNLTANLAWTTIWAQQVEKYAIRLKADKYEIETSLEHLKLLLREQDKTIKTLRKQLEVQKFEIVID